MTTNRLCNLIGIKYPIIQAPMNWITGADLAAAVSNAGGLGTIGPNAGADTVTTDVDETAERLRRQIRKVKGLTDKPFAVNFPIGIEGVEQSEGGRKFSEKCVRVGLEEGVPIAITSVGPPQVYTRLLKDAGVTVLHAVSTANQARKAEEIGVDAVVCEGYEGGGHKATTEMATMTLIPLAANAVRIPIIAAGGIADARGMLAALALGADGVYVGTRFIATHECDAHPNVKNAVVQASDVCTISVDKWMVAGRDLKSPFTDKYLELKKTGASMAELWDFISTHTMYMGLVQGDTDWGEVPCGQSAAMVGQIVSAARVIEELINELPSALEQLRNRIPAD